MTAQQKEILIVDDEVGIRDERLVAKDVIGMDVRVDDVGDRLVRDLPDLRQDLLTHLRERRVDEQHAFAAGMGDHRSLARHAYDVQIIGQFFAA